MAAARVGATHRDFELPQALRSAFRAAAARWLSTPRRSWTAASPRLSASVVLVRDGARGVEVFMQHRVASMACAPAVWVFPGGGVDPADALDPAAADAAPDRWPVLPGLDPHRAGLVLTAAVREVFEECGVLFAGPDLDSVVSDLSHYRWSTYRASLLDRSISCAQMLRREGLVVRYDALTPLARWITPECEPRRYDTVFFAATLPPGQHADGRTSEALTCQWIAADAAVRQHHQGPGTLMPPTLVLAEQIARCDTVADYLASPRTLRAVMPEPVDLGDRLVMRAPIDPDGHASDAGSALGSGTD
ncbi:MAG: NUDIX hydrolase [Ornithinimicrobium sp.]